MILLPRAHTHATVPVQALPVTIAFASVMYSHPMFASALPQLSRLLVLSNSAQQLVATLLSRLPWAVGQVQDLGLIFLAAMTSDIAEHLAGEPHDKIIGTALLACALSTVILGVALVFFGRRATPPPPPPPLVPCLRHVAEGLW